jgi:hypothetical protein
VPRRRCGTAYAAGYAGITYLFGYSFAPLAQSALAQGGVAALAAYFEPLPLTLWNLWAPVALVLAFAAATSLDRSRDKEGAAPALMGLVVGLWGTFVLLSDLLAAGRVSARHPHRPALTDPDILEQVLVGLRNL